MERRLPSGARSEGSLGPLDPQHFPAPAEFGEGAFRRVLRRERAHLDGARARAVALLDADAERVPTGAGGAGAGAGGAGRAALRTVVRATGRGRGAGAAVPAAGAGDAARRAAAAARASERFAASASSWPRSSKYGGGGLWTRRPRPPRTTPASCGGATWRRATLASTSKLVPSPAWKRSRIGAPGVGRGLGLDEDACLRQVEHDAAIAAAVDRELAGRAPLDPDASAALRTSSPRVSASRWPGLRPGPGYPRGENSVRRTIVSSRPGPTEIRSTGTPDERLDPLHVAARVLGQVVVLAGSRARSARASPGASRRRAPRGRARSSVIGNSSMSLPSIR